MSDGRTERERERAVAAHGLELIRQAYREATGEELPSMQKPGWGR